MIVLVLFKDLGQRTWASTYPTLASEVVIEIDNIQKSSGPGTLQRNPRRSHFPLRFTFKQVLMSEDPHRAVFSRLA